jgi:hypothetical protein
VKYPKVTGATTTAKYTLTHGTTTEPAVTKDQTANPGTWVSPGSYTLRQGEAAKLRLEPERRRHPGRRRGQAGA